MVGDDAEQPECRVEFHHVAGGYIVRNVLLGAGEQSMKIADLDTETKSVIVMAHAVARNPTEHNLERLRKALAKYGKKHEAERAHNLLRAIFDE